MPDFFVPADTNGVNSFYTSVVSKNLVYTFAFKYADQNRSKLKSLNDHKNIEDYLIEKKVFNQLVDQIKSSGISYSNKEFNESKELIEKQLYALIARNIIGDKGFYPIIFEIDNTVQKAIDILNKEWTRKEIVQYSPKIQAKSK